MESHFDQNNDHIGHVLELIKGLFGNRGVLLWSVRPAWPASPKLPPRRRPAARKEGLVPQGFGLDSKSGCSSSKGKLCHYHGLRNNGHLVQRSLLLVMQGCRRNVGL